MNDELQTKLAAVLDQIVEGVKTAGSFALEQLPDIAQSYVAWGRANATVWLIVAAGLIALAVWLFKRSAAEFKKPYSEQNDGLQFACGIGGVITIVAGITTFAVIMSDFLMVWFAPKVWLIREIAHLIK